MGNPKVGSLFAGVGGFDLGFHRAGFDVAWCVEIDARARDILARHFPDARIYADIREVNAEELESVDVVCGGFPCQDLSMAGKRAGLAGNRSGLFYDAMRIVRSVRPRFAIVENVCGLLSSNNGHDFAAVLREMGAGWDCSEVGWRVLDSQYFGVAQRRRRVFIVGSHSIGCAEQVLDIESWHTDNTQAARNDSTTSNQSIADSVGECGDWWNGDKIAATLTTRCHDQFMPDKANFSAIFASDGRLRRLTPLECERLQGFPDGWTDGQPDGIRYRQLGNAVTVNVAEWLARRVRKCLSP